MIQSFPKKSDGAEEEDDIITRLGVIEHGINKYQALQKITDYYLLNFGVSAMSPELADTYATKYGHHYFLSFRFQACVLL